VTSAAEVRRSVTRIRADNEGFKKKRVNAAHAISTHARTHISFSVNFCRTAAPPAQTVGDPPVILCSSATR